MNTKRTIFSLMIMCFCTFGITQPTLTNYDEAKTGNHPLPDLLRALSGKKISNPQEWESIQRPHILKLFEENVYGRMPGRPVGMKFIVSEKSEAALEGKAIRKQVTIRFSQNDTSAAMNIVLYLPKNKKRVPVFIGLNFMGNPTIDDDPAILPSRYILKKDGTPVETRSGEQSRRWCVKEIVNAGFGLATAYYQDVEPDHAEGWKTGIRSKMAATLNIQPSEWCAIGAWAWALSRIQDYLETDPNVDARKTILTGHSRLGKAALWAGAQDQRFAIVISNNSGEGGAALARRNYGETIRDLNRSFPHWFVDNYKKYNNEPQQMPVDQHMLLALIAPRPLYVASASEDQWADPKGEFLSLKNAEPVYNLYRLPLLGTSSWPPAEKPVGSKYMHYHMRSGKHDILLYDWNQYIEFARQLKK